MRTLTDPVSLGRDRILVARTQFLSHAVDDFDSRDVGVALGHAVRGFSCKGGRGERLIAGDGHGKFAPFVVQNSGLGRPEKKNSFHKWRGKERREALSISGAEPKGAEASTARLDRKSVV